MGLFSFRRYKSLSQAVLAGDARAARKMLEGGASPNQVDPDDDASPIHYGINHGPEMVQLLIDYGADVNIPSPRTHAMPLACAEARGYTAVAAVLRKAGARLRTGDEELALDPRLRLQLEPKIRMLVLTAQDYFPTATPDVIAERVGEKLNLEFPAGVASQDRERVWKDVRALVKKECGVKDYLKGTERPLPAPADVMAKTGMSEHELSRRFMEHLLKEGNDPFAGLPDDVLRDSEKEFPDICELARRKSGSAATGGVPAGRQKEPYQAPRTWDNLPSLVMTPVPNPFSYAVVVDSILREARDKELVSLVHLGWTTSKEDAQRRIQLLYEFADNPRLVLMRFLAPVPGTEQVIIRTWFMRETVSQVKATNLFELAERLSELAREKGLNTTTAE